MPVFTPITTAADLPQTGTRCEGFTLDFKSKHTTKSTAVWECAKDLAAFANHLGGTILVGIPEVNGIVGPRQPLAPADAAIVGKDYGNAQDLCHPPPTVTPENIQVPGVPSSRSTSGPTRRRSSVSALARASARTSAGGPTSSPCGPPTGPCSSNPRTCPCT